MFRKIVKAAIPFFFIMAATFFALIFLTRVLHIVVLITSRVDYLDCVDRD